MRFWTLLIAISTGTGWQWLRIAESKHLIDEDAAFRAGVAITALFILHQISILWKRPAERASVRERAHVVDKVLEQLLGKYYEWQVERAGGVDAPQPSVRCNVMLPVKLWFGAVQYLQIAYKASPTGSMYMHEELELKWGRDDGVVGYVWRTGNERTYSKGQPAGVGSPRELSADQRKTVSYLNSVYSVPILKNGMVVGVLTLDSPEDLARTQFNNAFVRDLIAAYANCLPSQCFKEGIRAK